MTDNSKLVLRWEIDNAVATLASGKAESGVFNKGGFQCSVALDRHADSANKGDVSLRCAKEGYRRWKCEATMDIALLKKNGALHNLKPNDPFVLDENNSRYVLKEKIKNWPGLTAELFIINDKLTLEFTINIINSEAGQLIACLVMFDTPNTKSNVILKIGEKKLYVSKEYLAIHSPVFDTMFFGNFSENGKEEVEIKEIVYEEFVDLLHLIYPGSVEVMDCTVLHVMKLADRFEMKGVMDKSNKHLIQSKGFDAVKKLLLADQYKLDSLRDHCLQSFSSVDDLVGKVKSSPEVDNISEGMLVRICKRILKI